MSRLYHRTWKPALASAAILFVAAVAQADVVYNNTTTPLNTRYASTAEFGDQIVLAGSNRLLTNFTFEYFGLNFSGDEQARFRIYRNDGAGGAPNTSIYDSGLFNVGATAAATLSFDLTLAVPDTFTWTVLFTGIGAGESAGLDLFSPPTVGSDFSDYWEKNGSTWELRTRSDGLAMDFGAIAQAASVSFRLGIQFITATQIPVPGTNQYVLSVESVPGASYTVEVSSDLMNWNNLFGPVIASGNSIVVTNPAPLGKRFFRARRG